MADVQSYSVAWFPVSLLGVDHLVYGTADLDATVEELERKLGVRATPGGRHPSAGTHNALIALGPASYLEIIGPDPEQSVPGPLWFGLDSMRQPRLITWAVTADRLEQRIEEARRRGVPLGDVQTGSRLRSDGVLLSWRFSDPRTVIAEGMVPFLIDWGESPHPAAQAAAGIALAGLRAEHPDAQRVQRSIDALGVSLVVTAGAEPALIATLDTPAGRVELH